jgi:hypothetical protein
MWWSAVALSRWTAVRPSTVRLLSGNAAIHCRILGRDCGARVAGAAVVAVVGSRVGDTRKRDNRRCSTGPAGDHSDSDGDTAFARPCYATAVTWRLPRSPHLP